MIKATTRPLLVVDGDNFAHRSYHALPKTIRRKGNRGGGAIVGFGNFLLHLYASERPRAVLVGWDTLGAPTYRQKLFPAYQGGRQFDDELIEQLEVLPEFVAACGFANAKAPGYEADDFLAAAVAAEEGRGGQALVASGDRDAFQLASGTDDDPAPGAGRRDGAHRPRRGARALRRRAAAGAGFHRVARRSVRPAARRRAASGRRARRRCCANIATLEEAFAAGQLASQAEQLRLYRRIATMDAAAPLPPTRPTRRRAGTTAAALARDWELNRLAQRLEDLAKAEAQ